MKSNYVKFLGILFVVLIPLFLVACGEEESTTSEDSEVESEDAGGTESEDTEGEDSEGYVFGYTSMTQNNPFFQVIEETMREEIEANGDELITTNPAMDVSLQISQIEDMIAQDIDAIFLNPVDWEGIRPALEQLDEAGIPIINYDTEVKAFEYVTAYVGSDNKNAGKVAGQDLVERFPDGGKIAVLDSPTMNSINDRIEGFMEAIDGKGFEIVAQQDAQGDLETALGIAEDIFTTNPDIDAVMAGNDPSALGALAAAKANNVTDVAIYGVDGSPDAKAEIAKGEQFVGSGAQSPMSIATQSVETAYQLLNGEEVPERIPVDTFLINEENVEEYGTDGWQ
ncbi:sugar ABC transporter substrate-binding protein [Gracilibacillus kekensis]|uniref:Monosaccharide ABC transporter substrate-binding protein, CUT2 family n=1 Tax=Gracilibacillus kekensis TaxID=1027249 RepID=A0A1M7JVH3_9BACI|nr:sugar ABC transporter substrate-binding protein [Gracilibacillus kekensis]SHM57039.1 monosaccharide ABC transporter substrate-binding protein, CUT2 family [Gracilibacillus kekensis]